MCHAFECMAHSTAPHCVCCTHSHDVCVRIIFFIPCLMFGQIAWSLGDVLGWLVYLSFFFLCFLCVLACRRICMSAHSAVVCFANDGYMEFPSQIHLRTLFRLASDCLCDGPLSSSSSSSLLKARTQFWGGWLFILRGTPEQELHRPS